MSARFASSPFSRNAVLMLGGALVSQLLVLGAVPFSPGAPSGHTSPSAIGVAALFMSWTTSLSVLGTMRLDLAAVLPESSKEASVLVRLILLQSVALAGAITLVVLVWGGHIGRALGDAGSTWMWFVGPMCVVLAMSQASIAVATRDRSFGKIALLSICTSAGFVVFGCVLWVMDIMADGLVLARLAAQVAGVLLAVGLGLLRPLREGPHLTWPLARRTYRRFHQFLVFNSPYSFSARSPAICRSSSLVRQLDRDRGRLRVGQGGPDRPDTTGFLGAEPAVLQGSRRLPESAETGVSRPADALGRPDVRLSRFAVVTIWGDVLFVAVFGSNWDYAGRVAMIPLSGHVAVLANRLGQRIVEATGRQRLSFSIQGIFDATVIVSLVTLLTISQHVTVAITVYAVLFGANNIAYLIAGIRAAGFATRPFLIDLLVGSALYLGFVAIGGAIRSSGIHTVPALAAHRCGRSRGLLGRCRRVPAQVP